MRKLKFAEGEYYHIYNRGVDKRKIFLDKRDHSRFLYLLYACNDNSALLNSQFYYRGLASIEKEKERDLLVDILCFCLMPNHFHLLLRQRVSGGISNFMQKIGTGYTMYFNTKYDRSGSLFQGTFKAVHIDDSAYLSHLTRYIHLNPAELVESQWKEEGIRNLKKTYTYVKAYPWSSYADYLGEQRFSILLNKSLLGQLYNPKEYEHFTQEWLTKDLNFLTGYTID